MLAYDMPRKSTAKNSGDAREFDLCAYKGVERTKHDSRDYKSGSDIEIGNQRISVKASHASLMSASLCNGLTEFDAIWNLYKETTHSNIFAYVTETYRVYEMNITEFEQFIYKFGTLETESKKNGGGVKIRIKRENKNMIEWLSKAVA